MKKAILCIAGFVVITIVLTWFWGEWGRQGYGRFLRTVADKAGIELRERYAVGLVFLNPDAALAGEARAQLEARLTEAGL